MYDLCSIPGWGRNSILRHLFHTGSGAFPASYPMGNGGLFSGGKAAGGLSLPLTST